MASCDVQTLITDGKCFSGACLTPDQQRIALLQLLCQISEAGGGGGGGVTSAIAGDGISVDQATGAVTITNTGVLSLLAGAGISVDQATGTVTIANTGVTSIIAGSGISVDAATGDVTVTNTGPSASSTTTFTNKRITQRVATLTDAATVTPDVDSFDGGFLATLSQNSTIANPAGTPTNFQQYVLRIKSTSSRTLTWGSQFRGSTDVALPTVTSGGSLTDYLGFQWNSADSKWDMVGKIFGF